MSGGVRGRGREVSSYLDWASSPAPEFFMNRRNAAAILLAALSIGSPVTMAQSKQMIQLSQLQTMFADMRARAPWNVDGPLLWGYFFFDTNASRLRQVASELVPLGYKLVSLEEVQGKGTIRLHVEKIETHTPETLNRRNLELYALAEKYGVNSYDGMDVGPVPK
jgi:hypothetical protein